MTSLVWPFPVSSSTRRLMILQSRAMPWSACGLLTVRVE
jgi:hypothetical protein